jgi:undecaprenyl-diphosphatase
MARRRGAWIVVALVAAAVFIGGFVAAGGAGHGARRGLVDRTVQRWLVSHQYAPIEQFFQQVTNLGGPTGMWVVAALGAAFLWLRIKRYRALLVWLPPAVIIALLDRVKRAYGRPRPTGLGSGVDSNFSFPSAHATTAAAVCCTLAFAFWREGLITARTAIAFAVLPPLLVGLSRLYLNVHWATDVLGGWSAGLLVALFAGSVYALAERREQ